MSATDSGMSTNSQTTPPLKAPVRSRVKAPVRSRGLRTRRRRVQLDLLQDVYARVERVQQIAGLDSPRAVFRESFRIFEWYTKRRVEGWSIQLVDAHGRVREVEIFGDLMAQPVAAVAANVPADS